MLARIRVRVTGKVDEAGVRDCYARSTLPVLRVFLLLLRCEKMRPRPGLRDEDQVRGEDQR